MFVETIEEIMEIELATHFDCDKFSKENKFTRNSSKSKNFRST